LKTLSLLAPDFSPLDTIWRNSLPFALWPVGHQSLLAHWMDEAVRTGAEQVTIHASDRPAEIRHHIEGGSYWSKKVTVIPLKNDAEAPADAIRIDRLPWQQKETPVIDSPVALLAWWLDLQNAWLENRSSHSVSVDEERIPGAWVGPLARVHPQAILTPPCWIGARAEIGADCRIGPNALIGAGSVLDRDVEVCDAVVMPDTYLGQNTRLNRSIAQGGILVDVGRACRVDIRENFIMAPVSSRSQSASVLERTTALAAWLLVAPFALLWPRQKWESINTIDNKGDAVRLATGSCGPLIVRRWPWIRQIFSGNMRWFGILPREESGWEALPPETAERLKSSPHGILSWADLHGCHDAAAADEWIHAAYQVLQGDGAVKKVLRRNFFHLALLDPSK